MAERKADPLSVECPFSACHAKPHRACRVSRLTQELTGRYRIVWADRAKPHAARVRAANRAAEEKERSTR